MRRRHASALVAVAIIAVGIGMAFNQRRESGRKYQEGDFQTSVAKIRYALADTSDAHMVKRVNELRWAKIKGPNTIIAQIGIPSDLSVPPIIIVMLPAMGPDDYSVTTTLANDYDWRVHYFTQYTLEEARQKATWASVAMQVIGDYMRLTGCGATRCLNPKVKVFGPKTEDEVKGITF